MASLLKKWFAAPAPSRADEAYIALVAQARKPFFYTELGVPDTLDGRFEMIVLHLFLLQHRLLREPLHTEFARELSEVFFADMDRTIREFGVMDTGVGKRIKSMGQAYNGRLQAYEAGLADRETMRAALARNLYGTLAEGDVAMLDGMTDYLLAQVAALDAVDASVVAEAAYAWDLPAARR